MTDLYQTKLVIPTPPSWIQTVLEKFDLFVADHASNERKAAAFAMDFVVRYPDRQDLVKFAAKTAQQEIAHFRQVYRRMISEGFTLKNDEKNIYIQSLNAYVRGDTLGRFLDRILFAAVIELRGQERFELVSLYHPDPEWKAFYHDLYLSEKEHWYGYLQVAHKFFPPEDISKRWQEVLEIESKVMQSQPISYKLFA